MKHDGESEEEHILECLTAVESLPDKDYYFLTVQCVKKLYEKSKYKKFVKEEILMQSSLYREPYEKGKIEGEAKMVIKLLTKRFGVIPPELRKRIESLDSETLDRIMDEALSYESIKDVEKTLQ